MAKRKNSKALSYVKYGALAFAIVGVLLAILLNFVQNEEVGYTGLQVMFGYSEKTALSSADVLSFSFMTLLTILLPLIGSCSIFFKNRLVRMIGSFLMLVGTIFCFLAPSFVVYANELAELLNLGLSAGAIISAISFLLGTACCAYSVVEKI